MDINLLTKYANKWVALTADRKKVVAFAKSIKELDEKVQKLPQKTADVIYHHVLPINGNYIP